MKTKLILISLLGILVSCDKGEVEPSQQPVELRTDDTITVTNINSDTLSSSSKEGVYNLLGFGYDVTGEFADVSAARHQVIDVVKLNAEAQNTVEIGKISQGSFRTIVSDNCEVYSGLVSSLVNATEGSNSFKGAIKNYFPEKDALSDKYIYASYTHIMSRKMIYMTSNPNELQKYLNDAFRSDIQSGTPQELIKKYGTHIPTRILLGSKLVVFYQAKTENADKNKAAELGLSIALKKVFGLFSGSVDHMDAISATGNFAQRLRYKTTGGDMHKLSQTTAIGAKHSTVILSDWINSIATAEDEFIDFPYGTVLVPLYELIEDPVKKDEMKTFIQAYLAENQVKF